MARYNLTLDTNKREVIFPSDLTTQKCLVTNDSAVSQEMSQHCGDILLNFTVIKEAKCINEPIMPEIIPPNIGIFETFFQRFPTSTDDISLFSGMRKFGSRRCYVVT